MGNSPTSPENTPPGAIGGPVGVNGRSPHSNASPCPVNGTLIHVRKTLAAGELNSPKDRVIAEEILDLLTDVAVGRAGEDHLPAIDTLITSLLENGRDEAIGMGRILKLTLRAHTEVFVSHVLNRNCATGECFRLTPAPCQMACPAGIDVPTYVSLIGLGRDADAIEVIRKDNPFPWVCGLVCTRPCEFMCVRGRIDTPVSIKSLKGFAAERALSNREYRNPEKAPDKGKKVFVIGAGPGGMSAAYYLALKGYRVTVIEALPVAGGMMMIGIPRYRLPLEVIEREVEMIRELGVEFRFNTRFGRDVTLETLKAEGGDAFFFAIGAHRSFKMNIPGEKDFPGVFPAIDFLGAVALGDRTMPGNRVVVVGGGNVAIDAARTCLRLGCRSVTIAYRRTRSEMPADAEEVEQAEEEGVHFSFLTVPVEVLGNAGRLTAMKCLAAELKKTKDGDRLSPFPIEGSDFLMDADAVIVAIGQQVDTACMSDGRCDIHWTRRSTVDVNKVSMETSQPGIFAAGDAVTGPATVVEAIGGGKRAAEAIDRYLSAIPQPKMPPVPVRRGRLPCVELPASTRMALKRPEMPLLGVDRRRITFQQVDLGYTENMVREEARRCLRCDICMRCGTCVTICREKMGVDALWFGHLDFDHPRPTDFRHTAEVCILCGACATHCPNDAMQIQDADGERILSFCGTVLNRGELCRCEECDAVLGTQKYIDFVKKRTRPVARVNHSRHLCDQCARQTEAKKLYSGANPEPERIGGKGEKR
jgi:NADPH-dependent glutamate synthase beta subunit-like oxidoreductase/ferredoxin